MSKLKRPTDAEIREEWNREVEELSINRSAGWALIKRPIVEGKYANQGLFSFTLFRCMGAQWEPHSVYSQVGTAKQRDMNAEADATAKFNEVAYPNRAAEWFKEQGERPTQMGLKL